MLVIGTERLSLMGGVEALLDQSRRVPNHKNRVDQVVEQAVIEYAIQDPAHGQVRVSNELRKKGVFVSPSGVRSICLRNFYRLYGTGQAHQHRHKLPLFRRNPHKIIGVGAGEFTQFG